MMNKLALAGLGAAVLSAVMLSAPAAQAAEPRNGVCETGEFCLYFNSDTAGSMVDLANGDQSYGLDPATCVKFLTSGNGRGECVQDETASVWNREGATVTVFAKNGWSGSVDTIGSGVRANLNGNLKNNNNGHVVGVGDPNMQYELYQATGGSITAYFDGYVTISGRHEGIDFNRFDGAPIHSLTAGTVTNICESCGTSGLSTIAIYNATLDKTVIYLHSDPLNTLNEGQSVDRGQRIGFEASRGASGGHTHVEMRPGRQTNATFSSDSTLVNPIPTEFWMNRGYTICCS